MDIAPMNKTAVIEFGLFDLLFKLWNMNKKTRRKLKWVLKSKKIVVKYYDERIFLLADWVQVGADQLKIRDNLKVKAGVNNYEVQNQCNVDVLQHLNRNLHCILCLSEEIEDSHFNYVRLLRVEPDTLRFYSNLTFSVVDQLYLSYLQFPQITSILHQIGRVEELFITESKLGWLDLSWFKTRLIEFKGVTFTKIVRLPVFVEHLEVDNCEQFDLISYKKVRELAVTSKRQLRKEELNWIQRMNGLKEIAFENAEEDCVSYFPPTIRTVSGEIYKKEVFEKYDMKKKFPYLIGIKNGIPLVLVEKLRLRWICESIEESVEGLFSVRPKEINVTEQNFKILNKHPEIFLQAKNIIVNTGKFSLDCVPYGIKKICFTRMNLKSHLIIRLGKESLEV